MATRTLGVSEARRLLPVIVQTIATEGGRVDVTVRGQPQVSIVRTRDLAERRAGQRASGSIAPDALRVEFVGPSERLVDVIRELRGRVGSARVFGGRGRRRLR